MPAFRNTNRRIGFEQLESRWMLAAISWSNEHLSNGFDSFGSDETHARAIVARAIDDWEALIESFNYDPLNDLDDTFTLEIVADQIAGRGATQEIGYELNSNKPTSAKITLDLDGGGAGWFFDETPMDDAEFIAIGDAFQSSFIERDYRGPAACCGLLPNSCP